MTPRLWVVDTHVLVAALLTAQAESPTARRLDAMLSGSLMFVLSSALLAEYRAVLLRSRLVKRHGLTPAEVDELLATVTANAIWLEPPGPRSSHAAPDAGDEHLWALLACDPAAALVTGNQLLLNNPYPGRVLMQPRQLWAL